MCLIKRLRDKFRAVAERQILPALRSLITNLFLTVEQNLYYEIYYIAMQIYFIMTNSLLFGETFAKSSTSHIYNYSHLVRNG